jgi:hypothetical protein
MSRLRQQILTSKEIAMVQLALQSVTALSLHAQVRSALAWETRPVLLHRIASLHAHVVTSPAQQVALLVQGLWQLTFSDASHPVAAAILLPFEYNL